jgi:hypothetical protein
MTNSSTALPKEDLENALEGEFDMTGASVYGLRSLTSRVMFCYQLFQLSAG